MCVSSNSASSNGMRIINPPQQEMVYLSTRRETSWFISRWRNPDSRIHTSLSSRRLGTTSSSSSRRTGIRVWHPGVHLVF